MTLTEAMDRIEALGWKVIAAKKHAGGVSFDATDYKRLAKGGCFVDPNVAMQSCLQAVLEKK